MTGTRETRPTRPASWALLVPADAGMTDVQVATMTRKLRDELPANMKPIVVAGMRGVAVEIAIAHERRPEHPAEGPPIGLETRGDPGLGRAYTAAVLAGAALVFVIVLVVLGALR